MGDDDSKTVVIINDKVHRRERKAGVAKPAPATTAAKIVKQEPKAVKADPKAALSKAFAAAKPKAGVKEDPQAENPPAESKKPAPSVPDKKSTPALKRGGSNTSSIMQAFSKAATKVKKAKTSQPATPSGDDSSAQPMSDDGEDDSEMPQPAPRGTAGRKTRKEREEELRRMMEEDDDDDEEPEERADSPEDPMDETPEEPAAPEPAQEEPAEVVTTSGDGRRRGKRKIMRKKQIMDEQGYLGTFFAISWDYKGFTANFSVQSQSRSPDGSLSRKMKRLPLPRNRKLLQALLRLRRLQRPRRARPRGTRAVLCLFFLRNERRRGAVQQQYNNRHLCLI